MDPEGDPSESSPLISEDARSDRARSRNSRSTSANGSVHRGMNGYGSHPSVEDGTTGVDGKSMDRITLTWKNVNAYLVPQLSTAQKCRSCFRRSGETPPMRQLLKNVTGCAQPGQLLAILGASGAGKTTLLNVLNQRNISKLSIEGVLSVNGLRIGDAAAMSAVSCYIQQDDVFIGTLTPAEHLWFQAMLRMDHHMTTDVRKRRIDDVIQELGLSSCADTVIGTPPRLRGISGGERKRLAFASEVLTNPALLFCDEPTSGLDSFMAENIISCLKKLASRGKTIICTIHQPSSQVYAMFDRVLLMAEGRVAYFGPTAQINDFFTKLNSFCPSNFNPADFYVHKVAIVPGREVECRKFVKEACDAYEQSEQFSDVLSIVSATQDGQHTDDFVVGNLKRGSPYKASIWRQFWVVLWRSWLTNRRDPILLRSRVTQTLITALVFGLVYLRQTYDQKGVMNINGSLFLLQSQMTFGTLFAVLNTFPQEYPIFMREHHNGMYRTGIYYISKLLAELPLFILMPIGFSAITYWMIGFYSDLEAFLIATAALLLVANVSVSFGYLVSCSTSNVTLALGLAPVILVPFMLFGGFYLNSGSVPVYFIWLKYISWFTYSNEIMIVNQWRNVKNITCEYLGDDGIGDFVANFTTPFSPNPSGARCFPDGKAVIRSLSFHEDNMTMDFLVLLGLFFGLRILSYLLLLIRSRKRE